MVDSKIYRLSELCDVIDCPHSTPVWTSWGKIVIRNFNIKGGKLVIDKPSFTNEQTFRIRNRRAKPESGDLILTREAPMGEVCIIPEGFECCLGQRVVLIKPKTNKLFTRYLLYLFLSDIVQSQIQIHNGAGSVVSNLRIPVICDLKIPLPTLNIQHRIAEILGAIDDKIELNRQMNLTLEQMTQALHKHYFVAGIDQENLHDGWSLKKVGDFTNLINASCNPTINKETLYNHYSLPAYDERRIPTIEFGDQILSHKTQVKSKTILFSKLNPRFPRIWNILSAPENAICSTEFFVLQPQEHYYSLLFSLLGSPVFQDYIVPKASGTSGSHQRIRSSDVLEFIVPIKELAVEELHQQVFPMLSIMDSNLNEVKYLKETRDTLLPKLISGAFIPADLSTIEQAL